MPIKRGVAVGPDANFITGRDVHYGSSGSEDLSDLRRQQEAFARVRRAEADRNAWMAIPALAPVGAVLGLEAAAAWAARSAAAGAAEPLVLTERMPHLRVGDNWATRIGRRAHADLKARVRQKDGWTAEGRVKTENGYVQPDVQGPSRVGQPRSPYQMELKPNTPSGRQAAARAVRRYEAETGKKAREIYYDPKDYR